MSSDSTPRVDRNDLLRSYPAARRSKRVFAAAALDVAFDVVLSEMHRQRLFELCGMVFKGGTAPSTPSDHRALKNFKALMRKCERSVI